MSSDKESWAGGCGKWLEGVGRAAPGLEGHTDLVGTQGYLLTSSCATLGD